MSEGISAQRLPLTPFSETNSQATDLPLRHIQNEEIREEAEKTDDCLSSSQFFIMLGSLVAGAGIGSVISLPLSLPLLPFISAIALAALAISAIAILIYNCCTGSPLQSPPQGRSPQQTAANNPPPELPLVRDQTTTPDAPDLHALSEDDTELELIGSDDSTRLDELLTEIATELEEAPIFTVFPKESPLPAEASRALIESLKPLETIAIPQEDYSDINSDRIMELLFGYERWMKNIAKKDFNLDLPDTFVKQKFDDFLAIYADQLNQESKEKPPEAFMDEVIIPIYDALHSADNRRQLVEELHVLKQLEKFRETPTIFLREKLCREFGGRKTDEIFSELIPELETLLRDFSNNPTRDTLNQLEECQNQIRALVNARELLSLKNQLLTALGEESRELVDAIMADWSFIGVDIKYNQGFLSDERKARIVQHAQEAKTARTPLDAILTTLKDELGTSLPVNETLLAHKYPTLPDLINAMPDAKKQEMHVMITRALVNQELTSRASFNGTKLEDLVLDMLGFDMTHYRDRDKIYAVMKAMLEGVFSSPNGKNRKAISALKREIAELAVDARFEAAGVPASERSNMQLLIKEVSLLKERLRAIADVELEKLSTALNDLQLPKGKAFILKSQKAAQSALIKRRISTFLTSQKDTLRNLLNTPNNNEIALRTYIQEHVESPTKIETLRTRFEMKGERLTKAIAWFEKYQNHFFVEFNQGEEDEQEVFTSGVCLAWVHRIMENIFTSPDSPDETLGVNCVMPIDRLHQAAYATALKKIPNLNADMRSVLIPQKLLAKRSLKESLVFRATPATVKQAILENLDILQLSNGGLKLYIKGHAVGMHLDLQRNLFRFVDSIFGGLKFALIPQEGQSDEDAALDPAVKTDAVNRTIDAFTELVDWCYDDTSHIFGLQLQQRQNNERIAADEYVYKPHQIYFNPL